MSETKIDVLIKEMQKLSAAIERIAGPAAAANDWDAAECFVWAPASHHLQPVKRPNRIELSLITGVDHVRDILVDNTLRFTEGYPANNVLLWGARGMGKSSLVKSVHAQVARDTGIAVKLVEVHREDIATLPALMEILKSAPVPVIVFCDDLSFDHDDTSYKSLKAVLDGGVEGRPTNAAQACRNRSWSATCSTRSTTPTRSSQFLGQAVRPSQLPGPIVVTTRRAGCCAAPAAAG